MKKADIPQHIVDTAMNLAVEKGWKDLSLAEISVASKVALSSLHQLFPSKTSIIRYISNQADTEIIDDEDGDRLEQPAKDRLFDLFMNRFDALTPYKDGLAVVAHASLKDPLSGLAQLCNLRKSMALMLEAAGLSSSGIRGVVRIKVLSAIYLSVFRTWLRDESEDLTKTMAALDRALGRLDSWAGRCSGSPWRKKVNEAA